MHYDKWFIIVMQKLNHKSNLISNAMGSTTKKKKDKKLLGNGVLQ
jgi:hypothetical protein